MNAPTEIDWDDMAHRLRTVAAVTTKGAGGTIAGLSASQVMALAIVGAATTALDACGLPDSATQAHMGRIVLEITAQIEEVAS